jgi:hypothetical protein
MGVPKQDAEYGGMMNRDLLAVVQDLAELIEAIDRRSPQLRRSGESDIVEAATRLRVQAQARISELTLISRESADPE